MKLLFHSFLSQSDLLDFSPNAKKLRFFDLCGFFLIHKLSLKLLKFWKLFGILICQLYPVRVFKWKVLLCKECHLWLLKLFRKLTGWFHSRWHWSGIDRPVGCQSQLFCWEWRVLAWYSWVKHKGHAVCTESRISTAWDVWKLTAEFLHLFENFIFILNLFLSPHCRGICVLRAGHGRLYALKLQCTSAGLHVKSVYNC